MQGQGAAYSLAPDTLEWESLAPNSSSLVSFLLQGDLRTFYADFRWPGWEADGITSRSRRDVPLAELLRLNLDIAEQLGV